MANVSVIGARGGPIDARGLLDRLRGLGRGEVLVMDADMVCGREHLLSAVEHATRSFANSSNSCKDMAMETMLFASGERQISKAQEKMTPKSGSERFAVVLFDAPTDEVLRLASLVRDDSVLDCSSVKATNFGITRCELETAGEDRAADLVLERVAFVEIAKR
jgi:KEOPS complex subunit Cgi121